MLIEYNEKKKNSFESSLMLHTYQEVLCPINCRKI